MTGARLEIAARALFAAPAARRALTAGRVGTIELVLSRGAYVSLDDDWLLLAEPAAPFGPLSVAVRGLDWLALAAGSPVRVARGRIDVGVQAVALERTRTRATVAVDVEPPAVPEAIAAAAAAVRAGLPRPPAILARGIAAVAAGRHRHAVRALAGLGAGLTPAGDDVLAGCAAWGSALAPAVRGSRPAAPLSELAAGRTSALGLAYLRSAERGELPDAGARLLVAIRRGSSPAAMAALPSLRAWGESSGVALGWGMVAAAQRTLHCSTPTAIKRGPRQCPTVPPSSPELREASVSPLPRRSARKASA